MISPNIIEEVKNRLVKVYDPLEIYLFGSYAYGTPREDSDLDLLIVIETSQEKSHRRSIPGQRALWGLGIAKDIIVYTKSEFEERLKDQTTLPYKVKTKGVVLYARA
jgi:predicted nucleotidyltransferase